MAKSDFGNVHDVAADGTQSFTHHLFLTNHSQTSAVSKTVMDCSTAIAEMLDTLAL